MTWALVVAAGVGLSLAGVLLAAGGDALGRFAATRNRSTGFPLGMASLGVFLYRNSLLVSVPLVLLALFALCRRIASGITPVRFTVGFEPVAAMAPLQILKLFGLALPLFLVGLVIVCAISDRGSWDQPGVGVAVRRLVGVHGSAFLVAGVVLGVPTGIYLIYVALKCIIAGGSSMCALFLIPAAA